ncbi:cation:proton antiporter [Bacillus pfraonensis]|uniref:cation:proton antiporter n=1 Tax=Bacillus TaxID=1386 RepID=UPI002A54AC8A|nr:cation:proton antiporter [Bacillus pseudomycoides]
MFSIQSVDVAHFLFAMGCLLALAHLLGFLAERMMIPRVIGEISAGLVLGPTLLGYFFPDTFQWMFLGFDGEGKLFGILYQIGLLMLMFSSGLKFQTKFNKEDFKITSALVVGATIPAFIVGWFAADLLNVTSYMGSANSPLAIKIVIAVSIAVTSIPVISKIFNDLGIMRTRFAKIVLACAGIHDIILWVALGYATAIASQEGIITFSLGLKTILINLSFIGGIFLIAHFLFNRFTFLKNNFLFKASHLGYFLFTMFMLASLAGYLHVEAIFGALLAGIMIKLSIPTDEVDKVEYIVSKVGFSWFIPLYFAIVGLQLDLIKNFNPFYFLGFLLFACFVQTLSVYLTSRMIKQDPLTSLNLAIAINDRGGPGIVLASIAYSTGIVNKEFFAVLVMLALMTSFLPGVWFRIVLKKKWRLMPGDENLVPDRNKDD